MTIPRLNGSGGSNLDKIQINSITESSAIQPAVVDSDKISALDSNTADKLQIQDNLKSDVKKEYSIDQFRSDYEELLTKKIIPELKVFEKERKTRFHIALSVTVVLSILAIYIFITGSGRSAGDGAGICIALAILIWTLLQKSFETKVKKKIMPVLMRAIPGFYWQQTPPVNHEEICASRVIPNAASLVRSFDDCFVGSYRKVPIAISECHYETGGKHSRTVFRGVVVKIKMNKNFVGRTILRPDEYGKNDLKSLKLSEVNLEDSEFSASYKVYSDDQIESRYLLTTSFMERFKNIGMAFSSSFSFCSFYGDSVYIAPHSGTDLFSLCSLVRPVDNHEQFAILFDEFVSILALVDYFKLDKNLGL